MSNENAVANVNDNALAMAQEAGFKFTDNFKGGAKPKIQTIKILHPAGMFEVGDKSFKTCKGYILDYHRANAWWEDQSDDSASTPPNCASSNALHPDQGDNVQAMNCATCERNKFGSDRRGGKGKDCTNMRIMHIFIPGKLFPFRMVIKPSSFSNHDEYLTHLSSVKVPFQIAKTEFTLERKSEGKRQWSEIKFRMDGTAETKEEMVEIKSYLDKFGSLFRVSVTEDDVDVQPQDAPPPPEKGKEIPSLPADDNKKEAPFPDGGQQEMSKETKEAMKKAEKELVDNAVPDPEFDAPPAPKEAKVDKEAEEFGFE